MPRLRVLVVDDDPNMLETIAWGVERGGHEAVQVGRFDQAKYYIQDSPPDALVTDVRLGAFNGLQLAILTTQKYPGTPVIILTGYEDPTLRDEAARAGATFVMKPVRLEDLLAHVKSAIP